MGLLKQAYEQRAHAQKSSSTILGVCETQPFLDGTVFVVRDFMVSLFVTVMVPSKPECVPHISDVT
jgi:hypothetical protein